jgi:glutaredoxin 3
MGGAYNRSRLASGAVREKVTDHLGKERFTVPARVTIYTTDYCPYCHQAKRLLKQKGAQFTEINVESRPDLRSYLVSASGQRTVPQVFINGRSVGGFSDISALDRKGELDRLLAVSPPVDLPALPT